MDTNIREYSVKSDYYYKLFHKANNRKKEAIEELRQEGVDPTKEPSVINWDFQK